VCSLLPRAGSTTRGVRLPCSASGLHVKWSSFI